MTTIILTIIGILLAAAAALMVIFYGGDAFNAGSVGAQANTYQNAGTNVISAVQLAKTDAASFATIEALQAGLYLDEAPSLPEGAVGSIVLGTPSVPAVIGTGTPAAPEFPAVPGTPDLYTVAVTGDQDDAVCARINENLKLPATPSALGVGGKMGCFNNTFFARL